MEKIRFKAILEIDWDDSGWVEDKEIIECGEFPFTSYYHRSFNCNGRDPAYELETYKEKSETNWRWGVYLVSEDINQLGQSNSLEQAKKDCEIIFKKLIGYIKEGGSSSVG